MIAPIQSLAQLRSLSLKNPKYKDLAIRTANKMFLSTSELSFDEAMVSLKELVNEDGEEAVVEEINACRDLV